MIVRMLHPEEKWQAELVMAVAYEYGIDVEKEKAEAAREKTPEEQREAVLNRTFGAFTEDGKLFAHVNSHEYDVRFDGGVYKLGGIGGVATLPPYRRGGAVRKCMEMALRDMYKNGFAFSFLYPFSHEFYRKFGYSEGATAYEWTLSLSDIPKRPVTGTVEQLFPGDDFSPLLEVYNKCFADTNLSALRETYDGRLGKPEILNEQRYTYLWRNGAGEPRGFMISHKKEEKGEILLDCRCNFGSRGGFLFCDVEAFWGLLSFAKAAFSSDYTKIVFTVPDTTALQSLIGENNHADCIAHRNGMLRVVNVPKVLLAAKYKGSGRLVLEIHDSVISGNNGTWTLTFAGDIRNVEKTKDTPDAKMSIHAFSALICGARPAADMRWMADVEIKNPDADFGSVFYTKPCYMMDLF